MLAMLARFGMEHEARYLERLREEGLEIAEITVGPSEEDLPAAVVATEQAMRSGVDVVYQASFYEPPWRGHADFLLRVDEPSRLGEWSYEPADTKLHAKATADDWLQLAFYAREVARVQGVAPKMLRVVTPNGTVSSETSEHTERLENLSRLLLARLESPEPMEPEPVAMCDRCEWLPRCEARWRDLDHLSLAGVDVRTRPKLVAAGISTVASLAAIASHAEVDGITASTLRRLRSDARLVLHERRTNEPHVRLRYPRDGKGLGLLPPQDAGDIYLDLEGFQFADGGPLEYLFGHYRPRAGAVPRFTAVWAHGRDAEKLAFETVVDALMAARREYPAMHVYHYNSYEPAAFRRLAERHDTRRYEVAALASSVFVDLLPIARYSVRTSRLSASLKSLEAFYRTGRVGDVTHATASMVAYDEWCRSKDDTILQAIEDYNREDCESLAELHDWLKSLADDTRAAQLAALDDEDDEIDLVGEPVDLLEASVRRARDASDDPALWRRVRRALVAVEFEHGTLPVDLPERVGAASDELADWLVQGKKEAGIPIAVSDIRVRRLTEGEP